MCHFPVICLVTMNIGKHTHILNQKRLSISQLINQASERLLYLTTMYHIYIPTHLPMYHTHTPTHLPVHTYTYPPIYPCTHIHTCTHPFTRAHIYIPTHLPMYHTHTPTHLPVHTYTYPPIYLCITHIHPPIYLCTHDIHQDHQLFLAQF